MNFVKRSIDKNVIQQILDSFVKITNMGVSYFDEYFEVIRGGKSTMSNFCSSIQEIPQIREACLECDKFALEKTKATRKAYIYSCHMGLCEGVVPVFVNHKHIGYFIMGQVKRAGDNDAVWNEIEKKLYSLKASPEKITYIKHAFQELYEIEAEKFEAAATMLDIIKEYIVSVELVKLHELQTIEKAKKYIEQQFTEQISIKAIADIVGLSIPYISSLFKKETGYTIMGYVDMLRIKYAKELLCMTSFSIKEISAKVGYDDQSYFSRVFKKYQKVNAKEFRQINKKA